MIKYALFQESKDHFSLKYSSTIPTAVLRLWNEPAGRDLDYSIKAAASVTSFLISKLKIMIWHSSVSL